MNWKASFDAVGRASSDVMGLEAPLNTKSDTCIKRIQIVEESCIQALAPFSRNRIVVQDRTQPHLVANFGRLLVLRFFKSSDVVDWTEHKLRLTSVLFGTLHWLVCLCVDEKEPENMLDEVLDLIRTMTVSVEEQIRWHLRRFVTDQ